MPGGVGGVCVCVCVGGGVGVPNCNEPALGGGGAACKRLRTPALMHPLPYYYNCHSAFLTVIIHFLQ